MRSVAGSTPLTFQDIQEEPPSTPKQDTPSLWLPILLLLVIILLSLHYHFKKAQTAHSPDPRLRRKFHALKKLDDATILKSLEPTFCAFAADVRALSLPRFDFSALLDSLAPQDPSTQKLAEPGERGVRAALSCPAF
ncbi:hypothetical protein [Rubritalea tangerina]|uniref:hypothetical protein n=1 Tax=Rubritalea tangerina TaxID=430798 RepID=UPI00361C632E